LASQVGDTDQQSVQNRDAVPEKPSTLARKVSERFRREDPHYIRHFISIMVARISSRVARTMPVGLRYWLADRLGDLLYLFTPGYRRNVRSNLDHVHFGSGLPAPTTRDVHNIYRVSARNWADLLVVPKRSTAQFRSDVRVTPGSLERLDAALARGKGCILITAHVGAFDFMGHYLHALGYKLTIVTGRTTARIVFDGVTYLRQSNGLPLVEATASGVRRAIQAVIQGECAVIVTDRDFFQNGTRVEFFGKETTLPPGAIRIARDTGASIVPLYAKRVPGGHEVSIHEPFTIERTPNLQHDLEVGMHRVVESLETALSRVPDQWVMFQSVWPSGPGDSAV
jgi:phosphatidylinositol dimannoside acyltransferase